MTNILFVCTGNSCRSQIAEGFGHALSNGKFEIKSAGTSPIGVLPMTIKTMKEVGIDISEHTSDLLTSELIEWADYIITLCNSARDNCPVIPPEKIHIHWDIENPDRLYLSEEARHVGFAKARDEIESRVQKLFKKINND
jgi:arsenate reductase